MFMIVTNILMFFKVKKINKIKKYTKSLLEQSYLVLTVMVSKKLLWLKYVETIFVVNNL